MAGKKNIPGSSFAEIKKIIDGYASAKEALSLDEVSKKVAMAGTTISRNTKFLADLGLITSGAKKKATEPGQKYARALEHKQDAAAQKVLSEQIKQNEFLSDLVTTIRIKTGMPMTDFTAHVLYVANQANNSPNRTGANAIADILIASGLVEDSDGKLTIAAASAPAASQDDNPPDNNNSSNNEKGDGGSKETIKEKVVYRDGGTSHPQVTINVTLQIPEVDDPDVYDRFFKAMKNNLFPDG